MSASSFSPSFPPTEGQFAGGGESTAEPWEVATLGLPSLSSRAPQMPRGIHAWPAGGKDTHQWAQPFCREHPWVSPRLPSRGAPLHSSFPGSPPRSAPSAAAPGTCSAPAGRGRAREPGGCPGTRRPGLTRHAPPRAENPDRPGGPWGAGCGPAPVVSALQVGGGAGRGTALPAPHPGQSSAGAER